MTVLKTVNFAPRSRVSPIQGKKPRLRCRIDCKRLFSPSLPWLSYQRKYRRFFLYKKHLLINLKQFLQKICLLNDANSQLWFPSGLIFFTGEHRPRSTRVTLLYSYADFFFMLLIPFFYVADLF